MKAMRYFALFMALGLIGFISLADGVDDRGVANNPLTNERANACYDGGGMAGKCETELAWVCGWYVIRVEAGLVAAHLAPDACAVKAAVVGGTYPTASCIAVGEPPLGGIQYMNFLNQSHAPIGTPVYALSDCTSTTHNSSEDKVYAPDGFAVANDLCNLYFGKTAFMISYNAVYTCN